MFGEQMRERAPKRLAFLGKESNYTTGVQRLGIRRTSGACQWNMQEKFSALFIPMRAPQFLVRGSQGYVERLMSRKSVPYINALETYNHPAVSEGATLVELARRMSKDLQNGFSMLFIGASVLGTELLSPRRQYTY